MCAAVPAIHTNVFVGFLQFGQHAQAVFDDRTGPLVHFVVLVRIPTDGVLDGLLNYLADIVNDELILWKEIEKKKQKRFQQLSCRPLPPGRHRAHEIMRKIAKVNGNGICLGGFTRNRSLATENKHAPMTNNLTDLILYVIHFRRFSFSQIVRKCSTKVKFTITIASKVVNSR